MRRTKKPGGGGGGGGGSASWGGISGTLADQSDLVLEFATKADVSHSHAQADITGLTAALALLAPLASPALTGNPTAPTQLVADDSTKLATTAFVKLVVAALINSSPAALDTLDELAAALGDDPNFATTITALIGQKLAKASNLSDLTNAGTARTNLGVAIGSDVQAFSANLSTLAAIATSANVQSILSAADYAAIRTLLGLVIGTNVQAYDADLTTWAGITPGTGIAAALAIAIGSAGAPVVNGGALGTPSSGTLTSCTGLPPAGLTSPAKTKVLGFGYGVSTGLTTGVIPRYIQVPFGATVSAWSIAVDMGTATVKFWKVAAGTALPTVANVINTSGVAISSGTFVRSTTVTDFTTTANTAGDIWACAITAVAGATQIDVQVELTLT